MAGDNGPTASALGSGSYSHACLVSNSSWTAALVNWSSREQAFLRCLGITAGRAALIAYAVRTGLAALPGLLRGRFAETLLQKSLWLRPDSLRLAVFFGSFSGAHALVSGRLGMPDWASGLVSGLALGLAPAGARMPVALFGFVRALEVCGRWLWARGLVPRVPHADCLVMVLASVQCVYAWIFEPQSLDPSYLSFLYRFGGHPIPVVRAVCANTRGLPVDEATVLPLLERKGLCSEWSAPEFCGPRGGHWCQLAHCDTPSCFGGYLGFWTKSYRHCVRLYTPVFLAQLAFTVARRLLRKRVPQPEAEGPLVEVSETASRCDGPVGVVGASAKLQQQQQQKSLPPSSLWANLKDTWSKLVYAPAGAPWPRWLRARILSCTAGVLRSAAFLATYCSNGWGSVCAYRVLRGSVHPSAGQSLSPACSSQCACRMSLLVAHRILLIRSVFFASFGCRHVERVLVRRVCPDRGTRPPHRAWPLRTHACPAKCREPLVTVAATTVRTSPGKTTALDSAPGDLRRASVRGQLSLPAALPGRR